MRHLARVYVVLAVSVLTFAVSAGGAWSQQVVLREPRTRADSIAMQHLEDAIAVAASGVWTLEGEIRLFADEELYKVTGYLAYVTSTATSNDHGDNALISLRVQPMSGGASNWIVAQFQCSPRRRSLGIHYPDCEATSGSEILFDYNFTFQGFPFRGKRVEVEITEPDDKEGEKRFTGLVRKRGRITLLPFEGSRQ